MITRFDVNNLKIGDILYYDDTSDVNSLLTRGWSNNNGIEKLVVKEITENYHIKNIFLYDIKTDNSYILNPNDSTEMLKQFHYDEISAFRSVIAFFKECVSHFEEHLTGMSIHLRNMEDYIRCEKYNS